MPRIWFLAFLAVCGAYYNAAAELPRELSSRPGCAATTMLPAAQPGAISRFMPPAAASSAVELLIAYTPAVLALLGSESAILDEVKSLVYYANQAHLNSGTGISYSVVRLHALATEASGVFDSDLRAATQSDGVWDELFTVRDQVKADMVSVLVTGTQNGQFCGLAWINRVNAGVAASFDYMFSIVSVDKTCLRNTLAHELGHNTGSQHDPAYATTAGALPYSYGLRFVGNSRQKWHTVMAPPPDREVPYFSTPLLNFDGKALGNPESADNARALSQLAPEVAALYASSGLPDLASPARAEPDQIKTSYKLTATRKRVAIVSTVRASGIPSFYQPVHVYFSKGRSGARKLRAIGRTDANGRYLFNEKANIAQGIYYRVCYPGPSELCSRPYEIRKVKA